MDSKTLEKEVVKDFSAIDKNDLQGEVIRLSGLFVKYGPLLRQENIKLAILYNKRRDLIRDKRDYYSGNADPSVYRKNPFNIKVKTQKVMETYIEGDKDIIDFDNKIAIQKYKVELLKQCIDQIKNRGFDIQKMQKERDFEFGG